MAFRGRAPNTYLNLALGTTAVSLAIANYVRNDGAKNADDIGNLSSGRGPGAPTHVRIVALNAASTVFARFTTDPTGMSAISTSGNYDVCVHDKHPVIMPIPDNYGPNAVLSISGSAAGTGVSVEFGTERA